MAARLFIQLLCMSYNVCVVLHVCSLQGVNCDVPDGVVYTDLHKTAEKGDELVLKCQFYGTPTAVYWKKGHDPTNSPNLITWVEGESASGSCVHDGSCKMNATFSLIIRNITVSDQGSYICRVSNYKGILIHNFTEVNVFDVPDGFVYTDLHKAVKKGDSVVLTCRFRGTPVGVWWKKGDDPRTAPNLVSWIPTHSDDVTGLCEGERPCQIMEMNEDRSLVIKEVSIAEQGRYICRVSSYKRGLIHNFTDISVFSPPMEPFPIINECQMNSPSNTKPACTISTNHSVEISCTASGYFPDIDLYFLHGSTSLHTKDTNEVTNLDGTKNKTISVIATASEISYVCFASDIPGLQEQRTTTILVNLPETPSTMPTKPTIPIEMTVGSAAKIVVPVIVITLILAAICVAIIIFWHRRKQRRNQAKDDLESIPLRSEKHITGKISFVELWYLVYNMDDTNLNILRGALIDLGIPGVREELTTDKTYDLLCDWKDTNNFDKEGRRLKNVLSGHGLDRSWKEMCERRYARSAVSEELLDHVLWNIGDERKICQFLRELTTNKRETRSNVSGNKRDVIKDSMVVLREWRDREHNDSQLIQLSLALERATCKPLDRTFFKADKTCDEKSSEDDTYVEPDNEENQVASMEQASESMPASETCLETAGEHESESERASEECLENASDQGNVIIPDNEEYDGGNMQV